MNNQNNKKKVEIYTADYCPFSHKAKELLQEKKEKFKFELIEYDATTNQELRKEVFERTAKKSKTLPQIFLDGQLLEGGCDRLFERESSGELDALLAL